MTRLTCACGRFGLKLRGKPIITAECHCNSCREAADRLEKLPTPQPMREPNGGLRYVFYRKDHIDFVEGQELLREFRLTPQSKTRRVLTACCNTPVFAEFKGGHWLSLFANLWPQVVRPAPELRTMVSDLGADAAKLDDSVPGSARHTAAFFARLGWAWAAMGFHAPQVEVKGSINA